MRTAVAALSAVVLTASTAACSGDQGTFPPATKPGGDTVSLGDVRLVAYSSCDDMLGGIREKAVEHVGPWGFGGPGMFMAETGDVAVSAKAADSARGAGAPAAPAHSTTNVQEAGVDEPDLVKTDGKRIITVNQGVLRVVDAESKKVTATLNVVGSDQTYAPADLLVSGDRALVVFAGGGVVLAGAKAKRVPLSGPHYVTVDLSGQPKVTGSLSAKGMHVDARMVGSTVRLVVRSQPEIDFPQPRPGASQGEMMRRSQEAVRKAPISAWLPSYEIADASGASRTESVKCEAVSHPENYTGTSLLTVHSLDLAGEAVAATSPIAVAADGDTVYGSAGSLYVASNPRWWFPMPIDPIPVDPVPPADSPDPAQPSLLPAPDKTVTPSESGVAPDVAPTPDEPAPPSPTASTPAEETPVEETEIHRFDIAQPGAPRYVASGKVAGRLLNQYAMSEHEGHLRIATTINENAGPSGPESSSSVYVLNADTLAKVGEVGGLGKDERIYAVRFIGPVGYVVTFRQVDPLYTLDLRDPAAPKVTGELKITGYSAYLHPAGDGRLIGVGQEASTKGRTLGTQISLFDVSDPAKPARLAQYFQKDSGSEAEWDPHAFLYWPESGLAVLPLSSWQENGAAKSGALGLRIQPSGITKLGLVQHPTPKIDGSRIADTVPVDATIRRSLIIGDTLWTVSDLGLKASHASNLDDQAWVPFHK
ncbi:beta-propeller domain-containing protein [Sinosporangium siamense]|uniref:Beta propeller domain-containing protein n=2 Tax=Sinosporangium siamense TaxID=1367973 RepID=A0A919RBY3_9ACTN|nr:beta-propeller domain-containing protein [Sinosporangium siamense]GII90847.1 hypothetical protein Ssi02_10780 [Sinosporangium siamense]